jgi:hypothetical protein
MEQFTALAKTKRWVGNNPITLKVGSIEKGKDYYATDKLDGLRRLLLFSKGVIHSVSSKLEFQEFYLTKGGKTLDGVLLDCEFYKKKYYCFDIIFYNGEDNKLKNFLERQVLLKKILKIVNSKRLIQKEFKLLKCPEILESIKEKTPLFREGQLDGVIITPGSSYTDTVFKWKPSSLLSNDFKVKKTKDSFLLLLLQNGQVFSPKGYPGIGKVYYTGKGPQGIQDGDVVEFVFENGKFKPLRPRPDKTKSNHITVILDNFKQMTSPVSPVKLFC